MIKITKKILPLILAAVLAVVSFTIVGCNGSNDLQETYAVVYDLNYDNAPSRVVRVAYGGKAIDWKVERDGYHFDKWYSDSSCSSEYDFNNIIKNDITLYASWVKKQDAAVVSFDYNFMGAPTSKTVEIEKGKTLNGIKMPTYERLGRDFTGWYKDSACTQEWNVESDTVTGDTTLYAGYKVKDNLLKYDAQGNIVYENVQVNVFVGPSFGLLDAYTEIAEKFNAEYEGKIKVVVTDVMIGQANMCLRIQQTSEKNKTDNSYYNIPDVYSLAGLDYNPSLWYEQASSDAYVDGMLSSIPLVAAVPHIVYNKAILQEVNGGVVPTNFSELKTLLQEVYTQKQITTISTCRDWTFKESSSVIAFMQNGAEYYARKGNEYYCGWKQPEIKEKATVALNNMYDIFGSEGVCHGSSEGSSDEVQLISNVANGNIFMGIVNFPSNSGSTMGTTNGLGYLPLSNLFTDDDTDAAKLIPGYSLGMSFYKAQSVNVSEVTAAAIFADYLSKNSYALAEKGMYPLRKSVVESDQFVNSENPVVNTLKLIADPNNIATLVGHINGKNVFNTLAAESMIIPAMDGKRIDIAKKIDEFVYLIDGSIY